MNCKLLNFERQLEIYKCTSKWESFDCNYSSRQKASDRLFEMGDIMLTEGITEIIGTTLYKRGYDTVQLDTLFRHQILKNNEKVDLIIAEERSKGLNEFREKGNAGSTSDFIKLTGERKKRSQYGGLNVNNIEPLFLEWESKFMLGPIKAMVDIIGEPPTEPGVVPDYFTFESFLRTITQSANHKSPGCSKIPIEAFKGHMSTHVNEGGSKDHLSVLDNFT